MAETLKEKTAKGLFWGAMNNGAMQVIGLVFGIVLGRLLSKADFGMMEEMQNIVGEEAEKLEETKHQFMNVSEGVTETRNETQNMRQKTKECAGVRQEMMDVISNLSAVSEENAASTQETTASMQVLNDTIATQADSAGNLSNLSKSMDQQLKFFEL